MITEENKKRKYAFITDMWNFQKKYDEPENDEKWWENFIDEADRLAEFYRDLDYAVVWITAYTKHVEGNLRRAQKGTKK